MELKKIRKLVNKNWRILVAFALGFGLLGIAAFFILPRKYIAAGSLLVSRSAESESFTEFTYEGYYAQQTARGFTDTLVGFLESPDARNKTLVRLGIDPTENNLRRARRSTKVTKSAPQVVTVQVKHSDSDRAEEYWSALVAQVREIAGEFNVRFGDPLISVNLVDGSPVVYEGYSNVYLNAAVGSLLGLVLGFFTLFTKEYLK